MVAVSSPATGETVALTAGQFYDLKLEYRDQGTSTIRLTAVTADARTPAAELGLQALDPAVLESGFVPFL